MGDSIDSAMRRAGVRLDVGVVTDHREARLPMVLAGLGGSLVERTLAESVQDIAVVRPCEPTFTRAFGWCSIRPRCPRSVRRSSIWCDRRTPDPSAGLGSGHALEDRGQTLPPPMHTVSSA